VMSSASSVQPSGASAPSVSLQDVHIRQIIELTPPADLRAALPVSDAAARTVARGRQMIEAILGGHDPRLLVIVGPCSIHDERAALDYATRLSELSRQVEEHMVIVMRVYFEKPRTTVGWKGLINDPHLDGSFDMQTGLKLARRILLNINELGLPVGTEMLDPITPQYVADLVTWASIGARTTESQTHRQMASGLSMAVGFKNGTDGSLETAINAMLSARTPHAFLGIDGHGRTCIVHTTGNPWGHLILRGGRDGVNYGPEAIALATNALRDAGLPTGLLVDCSHANSQKDYTRQSQVFRSVVQQRTADRGGNRSILGVMLESNLVAGAQKLIDPGKLVYGQSITDACIGFDQTRELLLAACKSS
jgi:3-deoxy-7-phosphoheptulonate synthase